MHIKLFGKALKPAKETYKSSLCTFYKRNCWHKRERNEVMQILKNNHNFGLLLKIMADFNCSGKDTFCCVKTTFQTQINRKSIYCLLLTSCIWSIPYKVQWLSSLFWYNLIIYISFQYKVITYFTKLPSHRYFLVYDVCK